MTRSRIVAALIAAIVMPLAAWAAVTVAVDRHPSGRYLVYATLLDAVGATSDGAWIAVDGVRPFTIHLDGITTATVQVRGSNLPSKPADNTDGFQVGVDLSANGAIAVDLPLRWLKVKITDWTEGDISAYLVGEAGP